MSYFRKPLLGLGGVEACGNDQVWDPNIVVNAGTAYELRGQCMPRGNYSASDLENVSAYPGVVKTKGAGGGGAASGFWSIFSSLTSPAPVAAPVYIQQPMSSGMSTTTKVALAGGAAILLLALLASKD